MATHYCAGPAPAGCDDTAAHRPAGCRGVLAQAAGAAENTSKALVSHHFNGCHAYTQDTFSSVPKAFIDINALYIT
ncbi:MAG: hypothetical protein KGQ77_13380, partial [Betaproteobacteria bacterium]|nr:hypothetical protein [Betaproteobacteria bacterium]